MAIQIVSMNDRNNQLVYALPNNNLSADFVAHKFQGIEIVDGTTAARENNCLSFDTFRNWKEANFVCSLIKAPQKECVLIMDGKANAYESKCCTFRLYVNDQFAGDIHTRDGIDQFMEYGYWTQTSFTIPAGFFRSGENTITLEIIGNECLQTPSSLDEFIRCQCEYHGYLLHSLSLKMP